MINQQPFYNPFFLYQTSINQLEEKIKKLENKIMLLENNLKELETQISGNNNDQSEPTDMYML